ncbi:hypothetical protein CWI84_06685 [Idiomarina tyrosinivorans]|uniref:Uncharacterized protein n=1 Tax=Idiomarina tyrosinivorans TaxID=1445662 RepID=A0A432ZR52_9GAMM|nr:hypothetical protein [Idiomarina tyrosinivorans]RUO80311.1 hypothetical protein CWI84_06685 [Idiomarina tyrosinivorans]
MRLVVTCLCLLALQACQTFPAPMTAAARARLALGMAYLQRRQLDLAYPQLQRAWEYAPGHVDNVLALAHYYQLAGQPYAALALYQQGISWHPEAGDLYNNYAVLLCQTTGYAEAQAVFLQALALPRYAARQRTYRNLVRCAQSHGERRQAEKFSAYLAPKQIDEVISGVK